MKCSKPHTISSADRRSESIPEIPMSRIKEIMRRTFGQAEGTCKLIGKQHTQKDSSFTKPPVILLAEDDKEMRMMLSQVLRTAGYKVVECPNGWNLLEYLGSCVLHNSIEHKEIGLVISDIRMPGITGIEILKGLQQAEGFPPIILITAFGDKEVHAQAEKYGAAAIFDKPFEIDDLLAKVGEMVQISK